MKKMRKLLKNEKGLTLIELLAVIVILAIVAAIAVPAIGNIIQNSRDKAVFADASTILSAAKLAMTDGACKKTAADTTGLTCDKDELKPYVEGITLATGDQVVKTEATSSADAIWTVTYSKLGNVSNTKFSVAADAANGIAAYTVGTTSIQEKSLNKAMNQ
ncbi:prepilin-type N-terminal cleavage/methylation domain-containing protein [Psychrobacillus sp. NEAU-3TGS]|uniref:type II secretion system protein n=1 Tax=Psychrobacillus sp. NEAU-3TGS TaxID=2995412 RepID=UPI00249734C2|nr:prepilin-type N-terminal cleavage/methylation domain-containing protein [Psychrobacillus sp. NEAU-3TGS]MDI2588251.1 prepilin-type N-terminal cleavage/methylation domain-containing protein [Psychrobacillus sp. NEAU-3TGS]